MLHNELFRDINAYRKVEAQPNKTQAKKCFLETKTNDQPMEVREMMARLQVESFLQSQRQATESENEKLRIVNRDLSQQLKNSNTAFEELDKMLKEDIVSSSEQSEIDKVAAEVGYFVSAESANRYFERVFLKDLGSIGHKLASHVFKYECWVNHARYLQHLLDSSRSLCEIEREEEAAKTQVIILKNQVRRLQADLENMASRRPVVENGTAGIEGLLEHGVAQMGRLGRSD